jgi:DNA-binding GntR family transcriptional regulator
VLAPTPHRAPQVTPRIRLATQAYVVRSPRARFAAGVLLAIALGFVPAHIVASLREDQAYRPIDTRVIATQAAVDSQASYDALDAFRTQQLDAKRGARNTIALTALLIWAAAGGVVAYVWFRRVPWARLGG